MGAFISKVHKGSIKQQILYLIWNIIFQLMELIIFDMSLRTRSEHM